MHILVVEDEPAIADTVTYALKTEGFTVQWCATACEAHRAIEGTCPDLIVLDVGLPDESGFDVCRKIRTHSQVPILFLTARDSEVDRIVGLEIGADDYVVKPFSPREVSARVRAILRRTQNTQTGEPPQAACPLRVDAARHQVLYFDVPLELSRYEFRLLEWLAQHPGQVFSREQLMSRVWDEPEASYDRTVDAHIKLLRGKLRTVAPSVEVIMTHRGVGYSLREDWKGLTLVP